MNLVLRIDDVLLDLGQYDCLKRVDDSEELSSIRGIGPCGEDIVCVFKGADAEDNSMSVYDAIARKLDAHCPGNAELPESLTGMELSIPTPVTKEMEIRNMVLAVLPQWPATVSLREVVRASKLKSDQVIGVLRSGPPIRMGNDPVRGTVYGLYESERQGGDKQ